MQIKKFSNYTILTIFSKTDLSSFIFSLSDESLKKQNLIIDLLNLKVSEEWIFQKLSPFYYIWKKNNQSFILVSNIDRKELLKDMIIINSLEEAIDFFNMDYLTRNI